MTSRRRRVATGFVWQPAENVPGAILPPDLRREQQRRLQDIQDCQGRALVRARSYYVS